MRRVLHVRRSKLRRGGAPTLRGISPSPCPASRLGGHVGCAKRLEPGLPHFLPRSPTCKSGRRLPMTGRIWFDLPPDDATAPAIRPPTRSALRRRASKSPPGEHCTAEPIACGVLGGELQECSQTLSRRPRPTLGGVHRSSREPPWRAQVPRTSQLVARAGTRRQARPCRSPAAGRGWLVSRSAPAAVWSGLGRFFVRRPWWVCR